MAGLEAALEAGLDPVKVNVVMLRGINDENLEDFAKLTFKCPVHVRFIEHMSFNDHQTSEFFVSGEEAKQKLASLGILNETTSPLGAGPAKYYQLPGALGTIGFILPTTGHFCGECNRLRLTADGHLRTCLFSDDEADVKSYLRRGASEEELLNLIQEALSKKPKEKFATCQEVKRKMVQIGG
jgi:cyclic pyranopterin phosphate synthase